MKKQTISILIATSILSGAILPTTKAFSDDLSECSNRAIIAGLEVYTDASMTQELKSQNKFIYPKEVTLYFKGIASVNEKTIQSGEKISTPGIHTLKITNGCKTKYYSFSIVNNIYGKNIVSFSLGGSTTAVVDETGTLYTFGDNNEGRLGNGSKTPSSIPIKVNGHGDIKENTKIVSVSTGRYNTHAIDSEGNLYVWGTATNYQLGNGNNSTSYNVPIKINGKGDIGVSTKIIDSSVGVFSSLAIDSEGNLYSWGSNNYGQAGTGGGSGTINTPVKINGKGAIGASTKIIAIGSGYEWNSALDSAGNLYTWGLNNKGQLGDGTTTNRTTPVKINGKGSIGTSTKITSISSGWYHSSAIDNNGNLYTWGDNSSGQLGDTSLIQRNSPIKVNGNGDIGLLTKLVHVSLNTSTSSAIDSYGNLYTWGKNDDGQLGNGNNNNSNFPIKIANKFKKSPSASFISSSLGSTSGSSLDSEGRFYTWGNNSYGQLGNATTINSTIPKESIITLGYKTKKREDRKNIYFDITVPNASNNLKVAYILDNKGYYLFKDIVNGKATITIPKPTKATSIEFTLASLVNNTCTILNNLSPSTTEPIVSLEVSAPSEAEVEVDPSGQFDAIKFANNNFKISGAQGSITITADTDKVSLETIGTKIINYTIKDNLGASISHKLTLKIIDTIAPVFKPFDKEISIDQNEVFNVMEGISATDNSGIPPTIIAKIDGKVVTGNIDSSKAKNINVTYEATDNRGNKTTTNRTVIVKATEIVNNNARFTAYGLILDGEIINTSKFFDNTIETSLIVTDKNGLVRLKKPNNRFNSESELNGYSKFQTSIELKDSELLSDLKDAKLQIEVKYKNEINVYDLKINGNPTSSQNTEIIKVQPDDWSIESSDIESLPACEYSQGVMRLTVNKDRNILFSNISRAELITARNTSIYTKNYGVILDGTLENLEVSTDKITGAFIVKDLDNDIRLTKPFEAAKKINAANNINANFQIILGKDDFFNLGNIKGGQIEIVIDGNPKVYPFKTNILFNNATRPTITILPNSPQSPYFSATNVPIIKYGNNTIDINVNSSGNIVINNTVKNKAIDIRTMSRN